MAQGVAASRDRLAELFEPIGCCFARLKSYADVSPTMAMTDIIMQILVEVLKIFGFALKELRRGRASEFSDRPCVIRVPTKWYTEKFLRKLVGMAELEDALKKLDRLTQEKARMAHAEVLRITQGIRDQAKVVDGKVEEVGDEVQGVVQVVVDGT